MQKITPFIWFNDQAEEAVNFYLSIFKDGKILKSARYGEAGPGPAGSIITIDFIINGQEFVALNGGPIYTLTPAISFVVSCNSQEEVDYYWDRLTEGGSEQQCAWLVDKFGVSWQIVPTILIDLLTDPDPGRAQRATMAMFKMKKIVIADLQKAADNL